MNQKMPGEEIPSRVFSADEITVPSYLSDLPKVRDEIAMYFSSIRRLDDTFGKVLQALDDSGLADNTLVLFMTDNGSAFPFAKANTYLASTKTPCFVRWPGVTRPSSIDREHLISEIDFFPTFMEATGIAAPDKLDGRSIVPLLRGGEQDGREFVFTQIGENKGSRTRFRMRTPCPRAFQLIRKCNDKNNLDDDVAVSGGNGARQTKHRCVFD